MKKLTLFLSVLLAMAVFAFAASAAPVDYTANEDGSFDVTLYRYGPASITPL